jgi:hypothetical protein
MPSAIDATKPVDNAPALTSDLRANLLTAKNEITALQASVAAAGDFKSDGTVAMTGAIATTVGTMTSSVANGASANGFTLNTASLTTTGAEIVEFQNNSVKKAGLNKDGGFISLGDGAASALSYGMGASAGNQSGMYTDPGFQVNFACNGVRRANVSSGGFGVAAGGSYFFDVSGPFDLGVSRNAAGVVEVNNGTVGTFRDLKLRNEIMTGVFATSAAAPTIASAGTIAPTTTIAFVSGTTTISTITAPSPISAGGGQITLIPTGLWATNTAGNIALATTAVVSKALTMTYDVTTAKWYPSY